MPRPRLWKWLVLMVVLISSTWCTSAEAATNAEEAPRPHIIVIMADDMGWNDVSFHGSDQILTPNIDSLAYSGVILHEHYTQPLCTPSRAAFLTGRYPLHTGMQHGVILEPEPWGLPLNYKLLPQHLNRLGYASHAVGKWHLGYYKKQYTPTSRGFSTHFGFYNGYQDYYKHTVQASFTNFEGYDMRWNGSVTWDGLGRYSTDLFTERATDIIAQHDPAHPLFLYLAHLAPHAGNYDEPLQAPAEYVDRHKHIKGRERRLYAGMVSKLDESVGKIVGALGDAGILQDSIIVFLSDNGAATTGLHVNHGSNWPLKGEKGTLWEGGIRTVGFVWSPLIRDSRVFTPLFHISDWLPTIYSAAGGDPKDLGDIDGVDQWLALVSDSGHPLPRHEILHNIDEKTGLAALRVGPLKYINGTDLLGFLDSWSGKEEADYHLPTDNYVAQVLQSDISKQLSKLNLDKHASLTPEKVKSIRDSLKVKCKNKENKKNKTILCNKNPCIFNIHKDPCEQENIYTLVKDTGVVRDFENRLKRQNKNAVKPQNKAPDPRANPALHNRTWVSWQDQS